MGDFIAHTWVILGCLPKRSFSAAHTNTTRCLWCSDRWLSAPPDGDGEWRLAHRGRPAGLGAYPLERRTGPVPTHAHRAEAEVQGDERR